MYKRIKEIRKALGLTQEEFAARIGVKRGAIANYEIGRNEPVDAVVSLICREYSVSETWLRSGSGEMFTYAEKNDRLAEIVARLGRPKAEATLRIVDTVLSAVDDETAQRIWDAFMLEAQRMIRENEKESGGE